MQLSDAIQVIADHYNLPVRGLPSLLSAVARTPLGRTAWFSLARFSNAGERGKVSLNFNGGNITDDLEITTTVKAFEALVKVGEGR